MSNHAEHPAPAAAAPARPSGRFALLFSPLSLLRSQYQQRPKLTMLIGGIGVVALIGFAVVYSLLDSEEEIAAPLPTLKDALEHLASGDLEEARHLAAELRKQDRLTYDERGGSSYLLGAALAREADANTHPEEQRKQYLIAARYLDMAYRQDFPESQSIEGLILLGQCWHDAGRYARALPILAEALKRRPRQTAQLHRMLASCYYRDANPQFRPALEHMRKYLADRMLAPAAREAGWVEQARIMIDAGQMAEAAQAMEHVPADSELTAAVHVLQAQLIMKRAEEAEGEVATALWNEAMTLLRSPAGRDPASQEAQREAQYLLGLCYLKIDDLGAAENQFSRSRSLNFGLPIGFASALAEADVLRLQGKDDAALEVYRQLLRDMGNLHDYSNPWLPLRQLRERLLAALRHYRDNEKFEVALEFASSLSPLMSETQILQLHAEVYRKWGQRLIEQAATVEEARGQELLEQSRAKYHEAADSYYRLARRSLAEREYPDYLWESAECYRQANDFHRTVRVMRLFLEQNQLSRAPDALLIIGESDLALGNLEAALISLRHLLRDHAKHPLSYRARLVAHDVLLEQYRYDDARKLLMENLDHESLTPRSLEWRDSLFALGRMLSRQGLALEATSREAGVDDSDEERRKAGLQELEKSAAVMHEAIIRLGEALQRYPDAPQTNEARYAMAEAYRQAAKWPRKKLPTVTIETTRAALVRQMNEELTAAHELYGKLIEDLNTKQDQHTLDAREREILRNCYFLQADTLFDLGKYEAAIAAYSSATNRYQNRPEALEAFVQIASCYRQLDQPAKARGTLEQAKVVLRRIPEEIEFAQTTRYSRNEWMTLLDFLSSL